MKNAFAQKWISESHVHVGPSMGEKASRLMRILRKTRMPAGMNKYFFLGPAHWAAPCTKAANGRARNA